MTSRPRPVCSPKKELGILQVGSIIGYTCQQVLAHGVPRSPVFKGIHWDRVEATDPVMRKQQRDDDDDEAGFACRPLRPTLKGVGLKQHDSSLLIGIGIECLRTSIRRPR